MKDDLISTLSEIRSQYNCFNESEEPYYRALSEAIKKLSEQADGDTISRQAAIDEATRLFEMGDCYCDRASIVGMLNSLPPAQTEITLESAIGYLHSIGWMQNHDRILSEAVQPERKWTPCSDKLPEESDGTVLVCFPDEFPYNSKEPYVNAKHNQRVRTAHYSQFSNTWYIGDFNAVVAVGPIAWMPLPEPYKEGGKNEPEAL